MKKLFLVALAAVGLASCVQTEELAVAGGSTAIAFGDSYVHNATKADPTFGDKKPLESFKVWAYMDEVAGTVLSEEVVSKQGDVWGYANTQYWAPNHTYYFGALAPVENAHWSVDLADDLNGADKGLGTVTFENVEGTEDLLYAKAKTTTPDMATLSTQGKEAVKMQFQHLLSKVKFTFQNGFATSNMTVKVSNVKMEVAKEATINLAADTYNWAGHTGETELVFGETAVLEATKAGEATDERLTIPAGADAVYAVSFDVEVKSGGVVALQTKKEATISGYALEMGKAYNFTAVINNETLALPAIEFTATVKDWDEGGNGNAANGTAIHNLDELKAALAAGGSYALVNDIAVDADETLKVAKGKNVVLDLYSHTITAESDQNDANRNLFDVCGTLTIISTSNALTRSANTGAIVYEHKGTNMGWGASTNLFNITDGGVLNLSGITAKNLGGSDMAFVAHLNNWGECTLNVKNCVLESTYIAVRVFNSGYDMNNVTIKDSTLKGKYCFCVHNYKAAGDSVGTDATLKLDIYNGEQNSNNTFVYSSKAPVLYGFAEPIYYNEYGLIPVFETNAEGKEYIVDGIGVLEVSEDRKIVYGVANENGLAWVAGKIEATTTTRAAVEDQYTIDGNTIKLLTDIDLLKLDENGEAICFDPIGSYRFDQVFSGTFDGQGHTIKNLTQNTWALNNGYYYNDCGLGLFGAAQNAIIKNLKIDKANISGESALCGIVVAVAENVTFENITVTNSTCADYQYYSGGIVGWVSGDNNKFINCNVDASTTIAAQWGDFDNSTGGVIGGASGKAQILMENCTVSCRIDAYNDITSSYQWHAYRRCGMLIGNSSKTSTVDGRTVAIAPQLTCKNVTVNYGDWMNYTYCEFAGTSWPYVRVQAGVSNSAYSNPRYGHPTDANGNQVVDDNHAHNEGEDHHIVRAFDQLYGGGQGVYGGRTHEGVTINYPASYNPNN